MRPTPERPGNRAVSRHADMRVADFRGGEGLVGGDDPLTTHAHLSCSW